MKFTTNTKPLSDSLNLGIINGNISNFHKKSCLVQLTATKSDLKINIEAARIKSEIHLKGSGDEDTKATIFVGSLLLKQLVSTLDSSTVSLEFDDSGLIIHSGTSKFTLPKMIDEAELELDAPDLPDYSAPSIDIDKSDWKFIKDSQMFAIAMSFIHPVYTRVWIGEGGDVIVGDFDSGLFTHSMHNKLGTTCLLSDTIVNLFNSLPDGSKLIKHETSYIISYRSDSFDYVSQFTPQYETDEGVGSYNSDIILGVLSHPDKGIRFNPQEFSKYLSQASMLTSSLDDTISLGFKDNLLYLKDNNVDCKLKADGESEGFECEFKTESLRKVISNYSDDVINMIPIVQDGDVSGITVWGNELTTTLAGVE